MTTHPPVVGHRAQKAEGNFPTWQKTSPWE
jgi:hypothetical protein